MFGRFPLDERLGQTSRLLLGAYENRETNKDQESEFIELLRRLSSEAKVVLVWQWHQNAKIVDVEFSKYVARIASEWERQPKTRKP